MFKKNLKIIFISLSIAISIFNRAMAKEQKSLNVCSESGFLPFEMKDKEGRWSGFDIDIISQFTKENNLSLKMLDIGLNGLIPALSTKKCDLIASAFTITPERSKMVLFSTPIYTVIITAAFINKPEIKSKFKKFSDIDNNNVKIASQTGSEATTFLRSMLKKATLLEYATANDEVNAILEKKAQLFVDDDLFIRQVEKKFKWQFYKLSSTEHGSLAFAARKYDIKLIYKLNTFIAKIKQNGTYAAIAAKYFD